MAAGSSLYFAGADASITAGGDTIGAVSGWNFNISWERNDKYSSDSIFMRATAKYRQKVEVKLKYAAIDPTVSGGTWWAFKSLRGGGDTGIDKNGTSVDMGSIADTSKLTFFDIAGTVQPFNTSGTTTYAKITATAENCYLDGFPFEVKENEWMFVDATAHAADIVFTNPT